MLLRDRVAKKETYGKILLFIIICNKYLGWWYPTISACGVMVIVVGNGHGETSSNPGPS